MNPVQAFVANNYTGAGPTPAVFYSGGISSFEVLGTFGGATVTLQKMGPDGSTWETVGATTTVTAAAFAQGLNLPAGCYRLSLSAAVTNLYATIAASLD